MKKAVALFLCGAVLPSLILAGCTEKKETGTSQTTLQAENTSKEETQTETTESSSKPVYDNKRMDADKLQKVIELYKAKEPNGEHYIPVYEDGIPGYGLYCYLSDDNTFRFDYSSINGQSVCLILDTIGEMAYFDFRMNYGDNTYWTYGVNVPVGVSQLESFIDSWLEGDLSEFTLDDSALAENKDNILKDIPILYARLAKVADNAFPELGFGLDELGVDFGTKYTSIDPTQLTSTEFEITNEHKFANGVCSDCGMVWTQYFYDVLGKYPQDSQDYRVLYEQKSKSLLRAEDELRCSANGADSAELIYFSNREETLEECKVNIVNSNGKPDCSIIYTLDEKMVSLGEGVITYKYQYYLSISAKPGEYDKVFESREALAENCDVFLFIRNDNGVGTDAYSSKSDEEIKKILDADGCEFFTKDEFLNMFMERHTAFFESIDKGMVWIDTTLADAGINWK